jgi:hypothetical protein
MTSARRCACRPGGRSRPARLRATSSRCHRRIVSGVTIVATCASRRRPRRCPSSARRRRSRSSNRRLPGEAGLQEAILFAKVRDHVGLLPMEPAAQGRDQQLERQHAQSLRHCDRSTCGTLRARRSLSNATTKSSGAPQDRGIRAVCWTWLGDVVRVVGHYAIASGCFEQKLADYARPGIATVGSPRITVLSTSRAASCSASNMPSAASPELKRLYALSY